MFLWCHSPLCCCSALRSLSSRRQHRLTFSDMEIRLELKHPSDGGKCTLSAQISFLDLFPKTISSLILFVDSQSIAFRVFSVFQVLALARAAVGPLVRWCWLLSAHLVRSECSADVTWACVGGTGIFSTRNDFGGSS